MSAKDDAAINEIFEVIAKNLAGTNALYGLVAVMQLLQALLGDEDVFDGQPKPAEMAALAMLLDVNLMLIDRFLGAASSPETRH